MLKKTAERYIADKAGELLNQNDAFNPCMSRNCFAIEKNCAKGLSQSFASRFVALQNISFVLR